MTLERVDDSRLWRAILEALNVASPNFLSKHDVARELNSLCQDQTRIDRAVSYLSDKRWIELKKKAAGNNPWFIYKCRIRSEGVEQLLRWQMSLQEVIGAKQIEDKDEVEETRGVKVISKIKLFFSHSSKDQKLTEALVELVTGTINIPDEEIRCTSVPGFKLTTGDHTSSSLRQDLNDAVVVVGVLTKQSLSSSYVLFELGAAWGSKTIIKPLLGPGADFSDLKGPLSESNAVTVLDRASMVQLIDELAQVLQVAKKSGPTVDRKVTSFLERLASLPKA